MRLHRAAIRAAVLGTGRVLSAFMLLCLLAPVCARGDSTQACFTTVPTSKVTIGGYLNSDASIVPPGSIPQTDTAGAFPTATTTFAGLNALAAMLGGVQIYDTLGIPHLVTIAFFHTGPLEFTVRAYVASEDVDPTGTAKGLPRQVTIAGGSASQGDTILTFNALGQRIGGTPGSADLVASIPWNNGAAASAVRVSYAPIYAVDAGLPSYLFFIEGDGSTPARLSGATVVADSSVPRAGVGVALALNMPVEPPIIPPAAIPAVSVAGGAVGSTTTFADLNAIAASGATVDISDALAQTHTLTLFFFHTAPGTYTARTYVNSEEVDPSGTTKGLPRQATVDGGTAAAGSFDINFDTYGQRNNQPAIGIPDVLLSIPWNNGSSAQFVHLALAPATQLGNESLVCATAIDYCLNDALKTAPGVCGCGAPDRDDNHNGVADCLEPTPTPSVTPTQAPPVATATPPPGDDLCPDDPAKSTPGICGCGVSDVDLDESGVVDCRELWATTAPAKAQVTVSGSRVHIAMQKFAAVVAYELELRSSRRSLRRSTRLPSVQLGRLAAGMWRVRYRVKAVAPDGTLIRSLQSEWAAFQMR